MRELVHFYQRDKGSLARLKSDLLKMAPAARQQFFHRADIFDVLTGNGPGQYGLHQAFVPYAATRDGLKKVCWIASQIEAGSVRDVRVDMLHMLPASADLSRSMSEGIKDAMQANTNDADHEGKLVLLAEAFPCLLSGKTLGVCRLVKHCSLLMEVCVLFLAGALAPLTEQLEAKNEGDTGIFLTKRVLLACDKQVQLALVSAFSLAPRYDWHTMALAIWARPRLFDKLAFVWGVSSEAASGFLAHTHGRIRERFVRLESDAIKWHNTARKDKAAIAKACGVVVESMMINLIPVSLAREFALALSSSAPAAAAASSASSSSASARHFFSFSEQEFADVPSAVNAWLS